MDKKILTILDQNCFINYGEKIQIYGRGVGGGGGGGVGGGSLVTRFFLILRKKSSEHV